MIYLGRLAHLVELQLISTSSYTCSPEWLQQFALVFMSRMYSMGAAVCDSTVARCSTYSYFIYIVIL